MTLLKALAAQVLGGAAVFALLASGLAGSPPVWLLVALQAGSAALVAAALGSERWWIAIHLGFLPLALAARQLGLAPGWYLAAFALTALVFWSSYRTRVPLYLSNARTVKALHDLLPPRASGRLLDIGSGTGSVVRALAQLRPGWQFTGIEAAPLPHWIARLLAARQSNLALQRGDFFRSPWTEYDVIYAFLSPVPMAQVWAKACAEMRPGSLLVSNSFGVPGIEPECQLQLDDRRGTRLLCYRPGSSKAETGR